MNPCVRRHASVTDTITALCVLDDQRDDRIESTLETLAADDGFAIRTASTSAEAVARLNDVDCLVGAFESVTRDDGALLERAEDLAPALPVVLLVESAEESMAAVDVVQSRPWTDCIAHRTATAVPERLGHRIRTVVEHRRLADLSRRSLASVELTQDAVAVATPDGALAFANRSYAMQFGYDREALPGTPWRALFDDESVERLETAAIPTVADGWRWTGSCTARRKTGATFPVRVRLGGLEDGSLVFVVDSSAAEDGDGGTT